MRFRVWSWDMRGPHVSLYVFKFRETYPSTSSNAAPVFHPPPPFRFYRDFSGDFPLLRLGIGESGGGSWCFSDKTAVSSVPSASPVSSTVFDVVFSCLVRFDGGGRDARCEDLSIRTAAKVGFTAALRVGMLVV